MSDEQAPHPLPASPRALRAPKPFFRIFKVFTLFSYQGSLVLRLTRNFDILPRRFCFVNTLFCIFSKTFSYQRGGIILYHLVPLLSMTGKGKKNIF